ncbi:PadR family transcriptional regulator [Nonomuraea sp. MCN248]|uniref:PadR family transcriptional regulator n=1 Tax=Nonomuraea corallina TaxID=2989783 RepID=A0ABT4SJH7_9ACTN|nr:PadR family transcriptional regulator [Nonomuraea corallina]MDA0637076.1 PadR family transcriptional regulator [Nonomuraea corallina]
MSTTRILILGTLLDGPRNGYQVRRHLEMWGADSWASVKFGSIYHGLGKMAEEGLLEVVEKGKGGATVYAMTDEGRFEFHRLLMTVWHAPMPIVDPFQVAITYMDRVDKEALLSALRSRSDLLETMIAGAERSFGTKQRFGAPRHIDETLKLNTAMLQAQLDWCRQALSKVENDELP